MLLLQHRGEPKRVAFHARRMSGAKHRESNKFRGEISFHSAQFHVIVKSTYLDLEIPRNFDGLKNFWI
jgi:hypothetical protein